MKKLLLLLLIWITSVFSGHAEEITLKWTTPQLLQIRNQTKQPIYYFGHKSLPFHKIEYRDDNNWSEGAPLFWCGTGTGKFEIKPNETLEFSPRKSGYSLKRYRICLEVSSSLQKKHTLYAELKIPEDAHKIRQRLEFEENQAARLEEVTKIKNFKEQEKALVSYIKMKPNQYFIDKANSELKLTRNYILMGFTGRDENGKLIKKSTEAATGE
ncbi:MULTISPECIES: hypothetical protein [unclassified Lentimonas]|uniref:hypothetical protein n=1 Tax=unclassified Lentimonas TaxID=2630993 RepID=UPI00132C01DD|nr:MULTISPECIES: hypothetical protein [unclassified Lentimonas]CAA6680067.1 Unannotated [Lentimonas sp. CC4]CAA6685047.1 Unannotated [Lentimonas sp. CC6]CAA7074113.1 Unannotated [Lentimonas sp. CC4]CAA7171742.1 Unannotated [Lentimonas sp. CC21]CAA7181948.1 Unannotated [Lentimonas sp. CC8]